MLIDLSFGSSITIDIQVYDYGKTFAISYKGKTLYTEGDVSSCKDKLRKIVYEITDFLEIDEQMEVSLARTVIFKIWNHGWQGHSDISFRNMCEIKSFLCSLRSSAKFNIEVRTGLMRIG